MQASDVTHSAGTKESAHVLAHLLFEKHDRLVAASPESLDDAIGGPVCARSIIPERRRLVRFDAADNRDLKPATCGERRTNEPGRRRVPPAPVTRRWDQRAVLIHNQTDVHSMTALGSAHIERAASLHLRTVATHRVNLSVPHTRRIFLRTA